MRPTYEDIEYAFELLERINKYTGFFRLNEHSEAKDINCVYETFNSYLQLIGIDFYSGASKYCLINDEFDWAIKFDIPECDSKWKKINDYALHEAEIYEKAVEWGIEDSFAACYCIGYINGKAICLQEIVETDEEYFHDKLWDYGAYCMEYSRDICETEDDFNSMVSDCVDDFSDEERFEAIFNEHEVDIKKLIEFINVYNLNDFHCGNYGMKRCEGREFPVLIDYSGY